MQEGRQDYPSLVNDIAEIKDDMKSVKYILNGNGKPGLVAVVDSQGKTIAELKTINEDRSKEGKDLWTFVYRTLLAVAITYLCWKVGLTPGR